MHSVCKRIVDIFNIVDGRKHSHCRKTKNLLHAKPTEDVESWLSAHLHSRYFKK